MTNVKTPNHLHRYKRANLSRNGGEYLIFRCTKPICSHYVAVELAEGKLSECNRCGEAFIMDKTSVRLALPHCLSCTKTKINSTDVNLISEFLKDKDENKGEYE